MKEYWVEISFMDKPQELKKFSAISNRMAISQSLMDLGYTDKDNVIGVKITYINDKELEK